MTTDHPADPTLDSDAVASWTEGAASHLLGLGLLTAVLVALPEAPSDLDRHQLPKELAVHASVWLAVLLARPRPLRWPAPGVCAALALLVGGSAVSALLATNPWLGLRATLLTLTASAGFLLAHHLGGTRAILLGWAGVAAAIAALSGLAQAWGAESALFAELRAPGGTLGNRNFLGHLSAVALPGLAIGVLTARWRAAAMSALGIATLVAILVLTRSRAAWLGTAAGAGITVLALLAAWRRGGLPIRPARIATVVISVGAGLVLALGVPNTLEWRSDSPYRDTLTGVANFQEGSGRGRLIQYRRTLELAAAQPVLGVGPGNWPIRYGDVAPSNDPSWSFSGTIPLNPWPSSDWMALVSERGAVGALAVLVLAMGLGWRALRGVHAGGARGAAGAALLGTTVAVAVVGLFDAVLLLPVPALWTALALGSWLVRCDGVAPPPPIAPARPWWLVGALLLGLATARSAQQVAAYVVAGDARDRARLTWAARIDPTSYPIRIALAQRGPCRTARPHIAAVQRLAPNWPAVVQVRRRCR